MERYIQSVFFFIFLFSLFGFIQWYVVRSYLRWLRKITTRLLYKRYKRVGIGALVAANIIFLLRFPSTELGVYEYSWFQALVIYPGGIFFGAIVLAFSILLILNSGSWLFQKTRRLGEYYMNRRPEHIHSTQPDGGQMNTIAAEAEKLHATSDDELGSALTKKSGFISRRQFLTTTGSAVMTAPVLFTIGASAATSHDYQVIRKKLYYPDLPSGLNGLRIVQLSDIHSGIYMTERQIHDIFHLVNEQHPDLIMMTGDFVDNSISEIPSLANALPDLKSEYGVFGCLGNHDHYASASAVTSALRQRKIRVLSNDHQTIPVNGESLTIIGVDDLISGSTDTERLERAVINTPENNFRILLSHRPDMFDSAHTHNIDLTLAGHTHGGQIGFNLMGLPAYPINLFQKYPKGLFRAGNQNLYVNVGIGMVGVPVRTVRPELTVIELTNESAGPISQA